MSGTNFLVHGHKKDLPHITLYMHFSSFKICSENVFLVKQKDVIFGVSKQNTLIKIYNLMNYMFFINMWFRDKKHFFSKTYGMYRQTKA